MKLFMKIVLSVLVILILIAGSGIFYLTRGLETGGQVEISGINLEILDDGIYNGKFESGRWSNEVNVAVEGHKITSIEIVKDVAFPMQGLAEEMFDKVIKHQNTDFDVVSEATVTSKAYLKSIENALGQ